METSARQWGRKRFAGAVAGLVVVTAAATVPAAVSSAAAPRSTREPMLRGVGVKGYGTVLGNSKRQSLYLLSNEKGDKLHCKGSCLMLWVPLYAKKGERITHSSGVKGKLGTVARGTRRQVTFNSYPVYTYAGDGGKAAASHGEGVVFGHGAIWYLMRASARTARSTAVTHKSSGSATTTTTSGGGYGY